MSGIDIFAWVVLLVMIATIVVVFVVLGILPGKIARQRLHPQAQAIQVASWLALIFGFAATMVLPLESMSDSEFFLSLNRVAAVGRISDENEVIDGLYSSLARYVSANRAFILPILGRKSIR